MQRGTTLITIGLIALTLLSGCALIFIPAYQNVTINTQNDSAEIYYNHPLHHKESRGLEGTGKTVTIKSRKSGPKQVTIKANGYETGNHVLVPQKRVAAFWPLWTLDLPLFMFGVPMIEPMLLYKSFRYSKKTFEFPLNQKLESRKPEQKKLRFLGIQSYPDTKTPVQLNVAYTPSNMNEVFFEAEQKYEKNQASSQTGKVKPQNKTLTITTYGKPVEERLLKGNYIDSTTILLKDDINYLGIEGTITKSRLFKIQLKGNKTTFNSYQKSKVEITWYLKNYYGEKVDSFFTSAYSDDFINWGITSDECVDNAILMNYYVLFKDKNFLTRIQTDSGDYIPKSTLVFQDNGKKVTNIEEASSASVIIKRDDGGHGSGFAISNDGYILTAYHVIAGDYVNQPAGFQVILEDGTLLPGKLVRSNIKQDVALIKVDHQFEYSYALTDNKSYSLTKPIYTIGAPKSIELGVTATLGMISNERGTKQRPLLQLNMSLNYGNSGGPLFEENGAVHGLIVAKLFGFSTEGIAFAIPSYLIKGYLNLEVK